MRSVGSNMYLYLKNYKDKLKCSNYQNAVIGNNGNDTTVDILSETGDIALSFETLCDIAKIKKETQKGEVYDNKYRKRDLCAILDKIREKEPFFKYEFYKIPRVKYDYYMRFTFHMLNDDLSYILNKKNNIFINIEKTEMFRLFIEDYYREILEMYCCKNKISRIRQGLYRHEKEFFQWLSADVDRSEKRMMFNRFQLKYSHLIPRRYKTHQQIEMYCDDLFESFYQKLIKTDVLVFEDFVKCFEK